MNVVGYLVIGYDKRAARAQRRANPPGRVSEHMLYMVAFFGGFVGEMMAMGRFRHKTRKRSFQFVLAVTAIVSTLVWAGWITLLGCIHL